MYRDWCSDAREGKLVTVVEVTNASHNNYTLRWLCPNGTLDMDIHVYTSAMSWWEYFKLVPQIPSAPYKYDPHDRFKLIEQERQ